MLQGTGSNVGKSLLVAGLCRAALRRGLRVRPFKPQNMSNNAAVTADGGEIGRAQALQALACGVAPGVDMNPVLLKPESETGCQVVVQGRAVTRVPAGGYSALKPQLMAPVLESFARLRDAADLVVVEGAGSPAEVNLRAGDIANMGFAGAADVPVVLVGDIDRGGVIAQLVGCHAVLDPGDRARVAGFLINKFRGDPRLFDEGYALIAARTGWPGFGVLPWVSEAGRLPAEDGQDLARLAGARQRGEVHIACLTLPRIANFDDLDPLAAEASVRLRLVQPGEALPGDADLAILPGTKSTRGDLAALRREGWDIDLAAHRRRGGHILGLCGGYQMLGKRLVDPGGHDGAAGADPGLGLLDVTTRMAPEKTTTEQTATHRESGTPVTGYEIHVGRTDGPDRARPFLNIETPSGPRAEGAVSPDGRVVGTYLHGLFRSDRFRAAYLSRFGATAQAQYDAGVEAALDALADAMERHLDIDGLLALAQ